MAEPCDENLRKLLGLAKEMIALADEGDRDRLDPDCGIIFGILRDAAYKLRRMAEAECERHGARRDPGG